MKSLLELAGVGLARMYALYSISLVVLLTFTFIYVILLGPVIWAAASHARGRRPWPSLPDVSRRRLRLGLEISVGLINPVIYLAILTPSWSARRAAQQ
jgi:hypothetical protein